jgi:hypothetical protein
MFPLVLRFGFSSFLFETEDVTGCHQTQRWSERRWSLFVPLSRLASFSAVAQLLVVRRLGAVIDKLNVR